MSARDALEAYMAHESDEDAAEFGKRLDAYRAEVLAEAAEFFEGVLKETLHPERDARYWSAVADVVRGLRCRAAGGESRG